MDTKQSIVVLALLFVASAVGVGCLGPSGESKAECGKDTDCDGRLVCNDSQKCVQPTYGSDAKGTPDGSTPDGGNGGNGGDGGNGGNGNGGGSNVKVCLPTCSMPSDCGQSADNWKCENGICKPDMCSMDSDCVPVLSGWQMEGCSSGSCSTGFTCITYEGTNYCAIEAGSSCSGDLSETQVDKADGSGSVTVCANEDGTCDNGACSSGGGCSGDGDCAGDQSCENNSCVCSSDSDCPEGQGQDKCYDGTCGCTDNSSCDAIQGNADYECQKF